MRPDLIPSSAGYTPARAFSCFSICVLCGALLASLSAHPVYIILMALLPLLLRPICLWPFKHTVVLALAVVLSFFWGVVRKDNSGPSADDPYFLDTRGRVQILGRVDEVRERSVGDDHSFALVLRAEGLQYPFKQHLKGKVLVNLEQEASKDSKDSKQSENKDTEKPASTKDLPLPGDLVEISGLLHKPRGKNFSFEFDEAGWLSSQGIFARLTTTIGGVRILSGQNLNSDQNSDRSSDRCSGSNESNGGAQTLDSSPAPVERQILSLVDLFNRTVTVLRRRIVTEHSKHLGAVGGALFSSMVLGDRVVAIDQNLKKEFSRVGLSHLLAASGLNLTIIVAAALALCRFFQKGANKDDVGWLQTWISFACVVLFTSFAGAGPSVSRAAVMCLIALWARLAFVKLEHGSALATALLIALALDPSSISDVGLQLSYGATFGIIYIYPLFDTIWLKEINNRFAKMLGSLVSVVVAAQIAVLPVQLSIFQQLSVLVLPANLVAEPVVVPLTILGFISSILAAFCGSEMPTWIAQIAAIGVFCLDWLAQFPLSWLMHAAHFLALFPLASLTVAKPQAAHVICYYLLMAAVMAFGKVKPKLCCILLLLASVLLTAISYIESPILELFCTSHELVVNRGNLGYFVCSIPGGEPSLPGASSQVKNPDARNYVRFLTNRGVPLMAASDPEDPAHSISYDKKCLLTPEALILNLVRSRSYVPGLELASAHSCGNTFVACPAAEGLSITGSFSTPVFIPYLRRAMPFSLPLFVQSECSKSAYYLSFRL